MTEYQPQTNLLDLISVTTTQEQYENLIASLVVEGAKWSADELGKAILSLGLLAPEPATFDLRALKVATSLNQSYLNAFVTLAINLGILIESNHEGRYMVPANARPIFLAIMEYYRS